MSTRRASLSFLIAAIAMAIGCESTTRRPSDTDSDEDIDYWGGTGTGTGGAGTGGAWTGTQTSTGTGTKTSTNKSCDGDVECDVCRQCQMDPGGICESIYSECLAGDDSACDGLWACLNESCPTTCGGTGGAGGGTTTSTSTTTSTGSTCDNSGDCNTCAQCAQGVECAAETDTCINNPDCVELYNCVVDCQDQACQQACADTYPNGISNFNDLVDCIFYEACSNDCG